MYTGTYAVYRRRSARKAQLCLFLGVGLLLLGLILTAIGFLYAGHWLVVNEPPQPADVIVVLAGDKGHRLEHGAALFHAGYAPCLIVSGGPVYRDHVIMADLMAAHAHDLGVPPELVLPERQAETTYANALYTKELMARHEFRSAIVVSSNYHMRRVRFTFERVFRDSGITLTYAAAADPDFDPARWWANNKSALYTLTEYIKLAGYALGRTR